jgi:hypothetical protein
MLSLEELRASLQRSDLSDERVAAVRDTLYTLANMLIDDYLAEQDRRPPPSA